MRKHELEGPRCFFSYVKWVSLLAQSRIRLQRRSLVRSLGQEDPLEEDMATYSSTAWRILPTEELGGFPGGSESGGKESACNAGDLGSIPGLGRSPGEGNGNPHQDYCLENPMDRGAW